MGRYLVLVSAARGIDGRILFTYVTGDGDLDRAVAQIDADGSDPEVLIEPELVGPGEPAPPAPPPAPAGN